LTVTAQLAPTARADPQVEVERKGGALVTRRTVTGDEPWAPELVTVKVWEEVWPTATWPKLKRLSTIRPPEIVSVPLPVPKPSG